jgi:hypothetical protein
MPHPFPTDRIVDQALEFERFLEGLGHELRAGGDWSAEGAGPVAARWGRARAPAPPPLSVAPLPSGAPQPSTTWAHSQRRAGAKCGALAAFGLVQTSKGAGAFVGGSKNLCWASSRFLLQQDWTENEGGLYLHMSDPPARIG